MQSFKSVYRVIIFPLVRVSAQNLYVVSLARVIDFFNNVQFFWQMTIGLFDRRINDFLVYMLVVALLRLFKKIIELPFYRLTLGLRTNSSLKTQKRKFDFLLWCTSLSFYSPTIKVFNVYNSSNAIFSCHLPHWSNYVTLSCEYCYLS